MNREIYCSFVFFQYPTSHSLTVQDVRAQSRDQERRHVGGDAAGRRRLRHPGPGEVQHREGHRRLHQEGVRQEVQPHLALHRRSGTSAATWPTRPGTSSTSTWGKWPSCSSRADKETAGCLTSFVSDFSYRKMKIMKYLRKIIILNPLLDYPSHFLSPSLI